MEEGRQCSIERILTAFSDRESPLMGRRPTRSLSWPVVGFGRFGWICCRPSKNSLRRWPYRKKGAYDRRIGKWAGSASQGWAGLGWAALRCGKRGPRASPTANNGKRKRVLVLVAPPHPIRCAPPGAPVLQIRRSGGEVLQCLQIRGCLFFHPPPQRMWRAIRPHGDVFPEEDDIRTYPNRFRYPSDFHLGHGRVRFLNLRLLDLYSRIGRLRNNVLEMEHRRKRTGQSRDTDMATCADAERYDYDPSLAEACHWADSLIGELKAIGGDYRIPYELRDVVIPPNVPFGCMSYLAEERNFIPEEFPVPHHLPCVESYTLLGDDVGDQYQSIGEYTLGRLTGAGEINSALSKIYGVLAMRLNRIDYHSAVYRVPQISKLLPQHQSTMQVNRKFCRVHFDNAVKLIRTRIESHTSQLFMMPDFLRERVMGSENLKSIEPMLDCTCLFYNFIKKVTVNPDGKMDKAITLLASIDKCIDTLSKRLRELMSVSLPEIGKIVRQNRSYARIVKFIVNKSFLEDADIPVLADIVGSGTKAREILDAWKTSIGQGLSRQDWKIIEISADLVLQQFEYRHKHHEFLLAKMNDEVIISALTRLDSIDKGIDSLSIRLRDLLAVHFPELVRIVRDNSSYASLVKFMVNKSFLGNADIKALADIVGSGKKAREIIDASRTSIGQGLSRQDWMIVEKCADMVFQQSEYRKKHLKYLKDKVEGIAPNIKFLMGAVLSARLISYAGSLSSLANCPPSTILLLGGCHQYHSEIWCYM